MEFQRINLSKKGLEVGNILFEVKSSKYYKVTSVGAKSTLQQIDGDAVKELSNSTLNRWYRIVIGYEEQTTENEQQPEQATQVEEVIPEPVVQEISIDEQPQLQEEIEPEIQPATPPAVKKKKAPNSQDADPVLQQLRQRIIDDIIAECTNSYSKETGSYTGLRVGRYNFAEVARGKRRFNIRVISKALDAEQIAICNIAPPSYGWTLDATFTVLTEQDYENAINLLKASYDYRLANTPN